MAKILVADDNSNIQKMVGLALKDQGIDVVAVGNGEAAVRKISDIRPDLVLADVFMPVRNGYEVCQYVKADPSLAHIPVILLVGAFDPLDEQEAQRVGADGVLKKPFVPPDPLISMVKSALQRAGVLHSTAAKTPEPQAVKGADLFSPAIPTVASIPVHAEEPIAALGNESFVEEVPARPEPIRIDSASQPVAFGSLLETPAAEAEAEDDAAFLPPKHSELATERDWRDPDVEETDEEEEEEKPATPWRREDAETYAGAGSGSGGGAKDWRTGGFEQIQAKKTGVGAWEPAEEKPSAVEAAKSVHDAAASEKESPSAAKTIPETAAPASPYATEGWAGTTASGSQGKTIAESVTAVEEFVHTPRREQSSGPAVVTDAPEVKPSVPETKPPGSSWFSATSSPWDAEIEKANRLASAWDSATATPAPPTVSETAKAAIEEAALPPAAVEAIREEAAQVAEDAVQAAVQPAAGAANAGTPAGSAEAPVPSMDELVAKVLAKMSPDVLQAVTREILKPVVEAMVKEEMKSKKS